MRKSSISPAVVQTLFDSASNAADKGQAQWFTPVEWARALALPLNGFRPVIADLTAGNGQLLAGAGKRSDLLGCDLEPCAQSPATAKHFVPADITRFYQLLRAVNWQCDTFVLNPPWDLHWYRDRLAGLAESECAAVREAFAAHDGRTSRETIDSTVATLCIALDRCSSFGEGFLIANESTLQRLILGENAPHRALAGHIWANFAIAGNICMAGRKDQQTGVIWFARGHHRGPLVNERLSPDDVQPGDQDLLGLVTRACTRLERDRLRFRTGPWAASYLHTQSTRELWQAAREESLRTANMQTANMATMSGQYHIWFDPQAGVICTHLNSFETASGRVDKAHAAALHALNGCQPIQLVVQRSQRQALLDAVKGSDGTSPVWRVDPALPKVVELAIAEYNRVRAPLYPLPKIQRLGYLDEQDEILCCQYLAGPSGAVFLPGRRYSIRSATVATRRLGTKINNIGLPDEVEWNGQELAFFITDQSGVERCFMEGRLREANVTINLSKGRSRRHNERDGRTDSQVIDFTLQELVTHFDIPEVPDVASCFPEQYAAHRQTLLTIAKQVGGRLIQPHGHPDDVAGLFHNILAAILLPAAQNDRGEQFPSPMHITNLRGELHKPPFLPGVLLLGEIAFADQKLLGELLFIQLAVREAWCRTGVTAGDIMRQMEQVGKPVFDRRGGQDQPVRCVDLADAVADDSIVAFDFGAFVNDTGGKAVLAQVGQGRGIDTFTTVRFKTPVNIDDR